MRLNLVGQAYSTRSLTAAAQTCVNLYGEPTTDPFETAKGPGTLYGAPGKHLFSRLLDITADATPVRGIWAGEGRLFVVAGTKYFEVNSSGHSVGGVYTVADDASHSPAQIIPNGNQLLIVASGVVYCDNGSGPIQIGAKRKQGMVQTYSYSGTCTTYGGTLVTTTGTFAGIETGQIITITESGVDNAYEVASSDQVTNQSLWTTTVTQSSSAGLPYTAYGAFYLSGTSFSAINAGDQIEIAGAVYTVASSYSTDVGLSVLSFTTPPIVYSTAAFLCSYLNSTVSMDATGKIVTWESGDTFPLYGLVGTQLVLDASYGPATVVLSVQSPTQVTIVGSVTSLTPINCGAQPFVAGATGAFLDSYYIVSPAYSRKFNISAIDDGTTWDPLDVGVKESYPDNIQSILTCNEQLYLFGKETFEVWKNVGSQLVNGVATFPFQRIDGMSQRFGSISPWGPLALAGNVYFIGGTGGEPIAYVLNGSLPVRVSTSAIESAWRVAGLGEDCVSYGYTEDGHNFWVINFGSQTWCFDATTGAWSERRHWSGTAWEPYRTRFHAFVAEWGDGGMHITGGGTPADDGGSLFESSVDFYDDNGDDIKWERALPYVYQAAPSTLTVASPGVSGGNRVYFGRMTLEEEVGIGSPPSVTRDYSDDRGNTFVNPQTPIVQASGDNSRRSFWPPGGSSPNRIWRLSGVGQKKVALVALDCEDTMGTN